MRVELINKIVRLEDRKSEEKLTGEEEDAAAFILSALHAATGSLETSVVILHGMIVDALPVPPGLFPSLLKGRENLCFELYRLSCEGLRRGDYPVDLYLEALRYLDTFTEVCARSTGEYSLLS